MDHKPLMDSAHYGAATPTLQNNHSTNSDGPGEARPLIDASSPLHLASSWDGAVSPSLLPTSNPYEHRSRFPSFLPDDYIASTLEHSSKAKSVFASRTKQAVLGLFAIFVAVGIALIVYFLTRQRTVAPVFATPYQEACTVYCQGPLLASVQSAMIWNDSKTFVDMPLTIDPADVLAAFQDSFPNGQPTQEQISAFVAQYFLAAGSDTQPWSPDDWVWEPSVLKPLKNDTLRDFAFSLNDLWQVLGRRMNDSVRDYQQRYSLVWQPYPMIVPGGRFVESYYWDSLWVIIGLLRCNMTNTAMGVASNLLHMLDTFGFVPNGGRVYYSLPGRSQPPMLSHMVKELYDATQNITFLARAYPSLTQEYAWWMQSGEYGHAVTIAGASNDEPTSYVLNRYVTDQHLPRPESWLEDVHTAEEAGFTQNSPGAQILYSEIAAAAETGWDFSARWFADGITLTSCDTSRVVPVELNSILYGVENNLAEFAQILASEVRVQCTDQQESSSRAPSDAVVDQPFGVLPGAVCSALSSAAQNCAETLQCEALMQHPMCQEFATKATAAVAEGADRPNITLALMYACAERIATALDGDVLRYRKAADLRLQAMDALLWDESSQHWTDLHILPSVMHYSEPLTDPEARISDKHGQLISPSILGKYRARTDLRLGDTVVRSNLSSASNFIPLWSRAYDTANATRVRGIVQALNESGLVYVAGIASTLANTSQQWDFPNGWSPLQHMIILGLNSTGVPEAVDMAYSLAKRWVLTNFVAYSETGFMHEKYDVQSIGSTGSGGEYNPQVGFGWTNGVALDLLMRYDFPSLD